ncbi:MAG TPA: GNAT family N-acetyltransferase [Syntrophales bacterium]|jgi:spermidine synthase|nr:GNAT family N-acetyltransferase [Syntrophales bacterium]HON23978.1 GNAT family N-acetyltransferase [Syntrophales bacterium]HOU78095.1 GNAT family N-acetyltransferase [Syntrophales bacterium]HPC33408.1 GNAT family N-acetyltransferase [Syntrophales bacterium]HQG34714.1 GNAT family N-acetyltransferase [Syntrophales bacterium]
MTRTYLFIDEPGAAQIAAIVRLYETAGWWAGQVRESPELVRRIVTGSHCFVLAREGEEIVGMGRAISDGVSDAYIQDVSVHPDFRRQGIGSRIVREILLRLRNDGLQWIGLVAGRNTLPFYRRLGFEELPAATAMLMMINIDPVRCG